MYKDYYLTVPTWSFHQCSSRCLSSSVRGVIISSHFSDVFFPKCILKTLESFREWWWLYRIQRVPTNFGLKIFEFSRKKNDIQVMLNFGAKIQIWEKNHSESLKDLNFGVKKSTFKSWALLARKLKKKLNFRAIKLCSFLARKLKYENSHSDWSKDFNFGAKIQHSNHGHFWRENSNMLKKSFWKFKSFEFWRQKFNIKIMITFGAKIQICKKSFKKLKNLILAPKIRVILPRKFKEKSVFFGIKKMRHFWWF